MYQNKLLAFKLSYCLGVKDETLGRDFPEVYNVAKSSGYLDEIPTSRTFRAINHIYYTVMRYADLYVPQKSFNTIAGGRYQSILEGSGLAPDIIYQDSKDVLDFLSKLASMSRQLIPSVYNELKPALDYLSFEMMVGIVAPSEDQLRKIRYMLRRVPSSYNIYFYASDLFNAAKGDILRTDASLRKCISLVTGRTAEKCLDTSKLNKALTDRDDGYFVSANTVSRDNKNIYLLQQNLTAEAQAQFLSKFSESATPVSVLATVDSFVQLWESNEAIQDSAAILALLTEEEVVTLREKCPTLNQVLLIPMAKPLYTKVLAGEFQNVRVLSMR